MIPETQHYLDMIEDLRDQVIDLIAGLPAEALNWRPLAAGPDRTGGEHAVNSIAVLAAHVAGAEHFWIAEAIGGYPPTRDRRSEFATLAKGPGELVERLGEVGAETRAVLSTLPRSRLNAAIKVQDRSTTVRWGILHVIDHTALHLGHMQITYQLWMSRRGDDAIAPSPRWYERAPRA